MPARSVFPSFGHTDRAPPVTGTAASPGAAVPPVRRGTNSSEPAAVSWPREVKSSSSAAASASSTSANSDADGVLFGDPVCTEPQAGQRVLDRQVLGVGEAEEQRLGLGVQRVRRPRR